MRIVITVPWGERLGGAEAMLQGVLDGAGESPHELEPVFFQDGPWPQELREAGLRVQVIDAGRLREAGRWLSTVRALAALLRERDPDVILNWSAKTQLYGSPAAVLARKSERVVWWQQVIPDRNWLDELATLLPTAAVGCYSAAAEHAQQRLWPRRRTFTVSPGTPAPDPGVPPAPIELPSGVPVVGIVGRLQPWKRQDELLRAQRILLDRGVRVHTLIVGGDSYGLSPDYAASLAPLARELGIERDVTMTGEVPDAAPYVQRMDVLVNASDPEPFGIVLLEGMAHGVAVVAVDSGGPAEFVENGVTGLLARSGGAADLADALQRLVSDEALRADIARRGRERFAAEFTTEALRRRFFARFQEIVDAQGSR
jgi:glycosyltransferase involved in cell wall biosynthesis